MTLRISKTATLCSKDNKLGLRMLSFYRNIKNLTCSVIVSFFIILLFQTFLYQPFKIPSESMQPILQVGDYLLVEKFAYGYNNSSLAFAINKINFFSYSFFSRDLKRGDIVVFLSNIDKKWHFIKRLIGLPGDEIQIIKGFLYINSVPVKTQYIGQKFLINKFGILKKIKIFREILPNGTSYKIYQNHSYTTCSYNTSYNSPVYKIPKNHYFFMGDNRINSLDSRYVNKVGYIHKNRILGKAKTLFWNYNFPIYNHTKIRMSYRFF